MSNGCANCYILGTVVTVTADFADQQQNPVDPPVVTLSYADPNGNVTVVPSTSITRTGPGAYAYNIQTTLPGIWTFEFSGGGAVGDGAFDVAASPFYAAA